MKITTGKFTLSVLCCALFAATASATDSIGEPGRNAGGPAFKQLLKSLFASDPIREYSTADLVHAIPGDADRAETQGGNGRGLEGVALLTRIDS